MLMAHIAGTATELDIQARNIISASRSYCQWLGSKRCRARPRKLCSCGMEHQ